jgi:hypothetical protein
MKILVYDLAQSGTFRGFLPTAGTLLRKTSVTGIPLHAEC